MTGSWRTFATIGLLLLAAGLYATPGAVAAPAGDSDDGTRLDVGDDAGREYHCVVFITPDDEKVCLFGAGWCVDTDDPCAYVCVLEDWIDNDCHGPGAHGAAQEQDRSGAPIGVGGGSGEYHCLVFITPNNETQCILGAGFCTDPGDPCAYVCIFEEQLDNSCHGPGADKYPTIRELLDIEAKNSGQAGLAPILEPGFYCLVFITPNNETQCLAGVGYCIDDGLECPMVCVLGVGFQKCDHVTTTPGILVQQQASSSGSGEGEITVPPDEWYCLVYTTPNNQTVCHAGVGICYSRGTDCPWVCALGVGYRKCDHVTSGPGSIGTEVTS